MSKEVIDVPEPVLADCPKQDGAIIDPFGRTVDYLRVSVTDRCDLRCTYCMSERMSFLPKRDVLSLEELCRVCTAFIEKGVKKLRLTGGEPLVRKNIMSMIRSLSRSLGSGKLEELSLTTNGTQLSRFADELFDCGVRRVNVSLDTRDPVKFKKITRLGELETVDRGIEAARKAGMHIKINMVALKGINDHEIEAMMKWCHRDGMDLTLIETMPLGAIEEDRSDRYLPLSKVQANLSKSWTLEDIPYKTSGPARYMQVGETGGRIGFITPLTHSFCESCNRVRLTCTGTLYMCLGQDNSADLRAPLRASSQNDLLNQAIDEAIRRKPKGHDFVIERARKAPTVSRHMSVTGG